MAAFESNCFNIQDDSKVKVTEKFFALCTNQKVYLLENEDNEQFKEKQVIDLRDMNMLREIKMLKYSEWCHAFFTDRTMTFNGKTYSM